MKSIVVLKSRIAFLGGLERYAILIAQAFSKNHKVTLLTTGDPIEVPNVQVISLGKHPPFNIYAIHSFDKKTQKWLKDNPHDIVFGLDRNSSQTHYRAGNGSHRTFLSKKASSKLGLALKYLNPKEQLLLRKEKTLFCDPNLKTLFTNSYMVKKELIDSYGVLQKKIQVVHNGIDFEKFTFNELSQEKAIKGLGLPNSKNKLLFIGNNYKRKGLQPILEALSLIEEKNFHLMVVGKDKNIAKYQKLAASLRLSPNTTFYGHQSDLIPYYQAADCFLLPSLYDPFANVTVEALAMGLFVITSQTNGGAEVLNSKTGIVLINPQSAREVKQALQSFFQKHLSLTDRLKIRKSIQHLDINTQLNKIVDLTLS